MAFFTPNKLRSRSIEIDDTQPQADSDQVRQRLARIEANYQQLESILAELESKMQSDDRLKAIDDANVDFEATFGIKKKRKWRAASAKSIARKSGKGIAKNRQPGSANPKKPR